MIRKQSPRHASFPVRFARVLAALRPKLASSRLRQRLSGAATSQTSRRKPRYRQSDLFSNSSWLYYLRTMFYNAVLFAHCQKLLACPGSLKRKAFSNHRYLLKTFRFHSVIGWAGGVEAISSFNTRGDVKCRIVPDSKKTEAQ